MIVFTGARSSGKTALVAELARRLDQQVPYARVDCETTDATDNTDPGGMLSALVFELNRQSGRYGRLAFPRLITGRLAIAQTVNLTDRARAREQIRQALEEYRRVDRLRAFLAASAPKVLSAVPGVRGVPGVSTAGRYLPDLVLRGLVSRRRGRRVVLGEGQDWYGHQDRGLTRDSLDVLVDLNRQATRSDLPAQQREVGELLWAAFLADLRDDFRNGRRADEWSLNCVVLVDNVDSAAGLRFLDGLITARRQHAAHVADDPDPLTVVATSRGALSARVTAAGEVVPTVGQASYAHYLEHAERVRGRPERGWYPVMLRDLTRDEVGNMVSALGLNQDERRVTAMVHGFTGGHPGSTRLVLDAIAERPDAAVDIPALLAAPEPGVLGPAPKTVERRLRDELLRGVPAGAVEDLTTCAAARDIDHASRLAARGGLLTGPRGERSAIFAPELWTRPAETSTDPGGTAVMPQVLRLLLLRRLAARPSDDPAGWARAHDWFRLDCQQDRDEAGELHHALALGMVESVARRLGELLPDTDVLVWLALLRSVVAAPNRLPGTGIEQVGELTGWADPGDLPLAPMGRLVAALWMAGDPMTDCAQRGLHLEIAADYDDIAPYSRDGLAVLRGQAERHRGSAAT
ncbi:MAG TPA: hypothetical protein VIS06_13845, partial [Mycobacteriales bacterium]